MKTKEALFYTCPECGISRSSEKNLVGETMGCRECGNSDEPVAHYEKVEVPLDKFIQARDLVVDLIQKESNCKFVDIKYSTGYYIIDFGHPVCMSFRVKGISRYLFGLWFMFNEETNKISIDFFGEHDWNVDKFKPTATAISSLSVPHDETPITLTKFLSLSENKEDMRSFAWNTIYYATDKLTHLKGDKLGATYGLYRDFCESSSPLWWSMKRLYFHYTYDLRDTLIDFYSEFQLWLLRLRIKRSYEKYGVTLKIDKREEGRYPRFDSLVGIPKDDLKMEEKNVVDVDKDYIVELWDHCKSLRKIEDNNISGGHGLYIGFIPIDKEGNYCGRVFGFNEDAE